MERDMVVPSWEVWDREQSRGRMLRLRGVPPPTGGYVVEVRETPTYDGGGGWGVGERERGGARGGVNEVADDLIAMRRRELMGSSDVNFTGTMILVLGCVLLFVLAVSPWGVPPPNSGAML